MAKILTRNGSIADNYSDEDIGAINISMALTKIDHWRCPLQQADISLYNEILDAITDCASDYEIDADSIDVEDVIWA